LQNAKNNKNAKYWKLGKSWKGLLNVLH
jgi:hypothetical protein